jgi:hypothetical protein
MVFGLDGQTFDSGLADRHFRNRPALQYSGVLKPQVVVETGGPMLLDDINQGFLRRFRSGR